MLVTALDFNLPKEGETKVVVYIPEGIHNIRPNVNGKPKDITVRMEAKDGEAVAAAFQEAMEKRLADNVRPTFDFDHKDTGPASALPKRFFYEKGKGLMAEVEWTGAGRKAIKAKNYSYLSPTFLLGDDGVPAGIPERGPLGALVNEPAFRDIPRIAASQAPEPETKPAMSKLIFAALSINASADTAEADAVAAIEKLKSDHASVKASLTSTEKERDELKAKVEAAAKTRADDLIKAAIADGRIAPKDEDTQKQFREKIEAGDTFAEEMLSKLPKTHDGIEEDVVKAGADKGKSMEARVEAAQVKARAQLGENASFAQVWEVAASIDPKAFEG